MIGFHARGEFCLQVLRVLTFHSSVDFRKSRRSLFEPALIAFKNDFLAQGISQ